MLERRSAAGPAGPAGRRAGNRGKPALTDAPRGEVLAALKRRPPGGGPWTGPEVARYAADRWAVRVAPPTGWRWLRDLGLTPQVPRPSRPRSAGPAAEVLADRAGWHVARRLAVPSDVVPHYLPPCTPDLPPVEPLWPLVREAVAGRPIGRPRAILRARLGYLARAPAVARPALGSHWAVGRER